MYHQKDEYFDRFFFCMMDTTYFALMLYCKKTNKLRDMNDLILDNDYQLLIF